MTRNVKIDYKTPTGITLNPPGSTTFLVESGTPFISPTSGAFADPDIGYWNPGGDAWGVRDANGNTYPNPIGGGTAIVADGSLNQPTSPQLVFPNPDGYYSHLHTNPSINRYAAWQMAVVDHIEMYSLWRFTIINRTINVNQKTFRVYGKGTVGIPADGGQNYEGWYFDATAGSTGIIFHPASGVSPQQQVIVGLWQAGIGPNGNWTSDGGINYASDLTDTGYHNLLTHHQLTGAPGGKPRARFWWDGVAIVQPDGFNAYNASGFAFPLASGGGEWSDGLAIEPPFGTNVPSWIRFANNYSLPVGFGQVRWWDNQANGQALPGSVDTFGVWLSRQPIDPNRVTF